MKAPRLAVAVTGACAVLAVTALRDDAGGMLQARVAHGPAVAAPPATAAQRVLAARAMGLVAIPATGLGVDVDVTGPRPGVRATTDLVARRVTLHVRDAPAHRLAHDLAHELGHVVDADLLDTAGRRRWLAARGAPPETPWRPVGSSDYRSGAGDFAEVHAACHAASPEFRSLVAERPSDPCALLDAHLERRP